MNVPSATAIAVEISAISSEFLRAVARSGSANGCAQWVSVKPCQVKLKRPLLLLNENRTTMKIGMKRESTATPDEIASVHERTLSPVDCISEGRLGEVLRAEQPGVDEDPDEDEGHEDERQRGRGRVVEDREELRLDHVADHELARGAEQRGVDEVAARGDEGQQRAGEDAGQREWQRDLAERRHAARVEVRRGLDQPPVEL